MTQQEINETREAVLGEVALSATASLRVMAALERLEKLEERNAILEAAVAFKGFDEVPEEGKEIDLVTDDGDIDREAGGDGLHDTEFYQFHGFTGWRYPVGDLS